MRERHWFTNTRFYRIYVWMKTRCDSRYERYREWYWGKWIKNRWVSFIDFKNDMYESYIKHCNEFWEGNTSIDRIDNNKDYCKENCRRATAELQTLNRSKTRTITVDGKKYNALTLANECWIPTDTASWRITSYLKGKIWAKSLLERWKIDQRNSVEIDGVAYYNKDIERITWVNSWNARRRLRLYKAGKMSKEKLFSIKSR